LRRPDWWAARSAGGDGFINPWDVVAWLARRCRASGVTIHEQAPVETIDAGGGRIRGVRAGALTITADVVVNAAGAWAGRIGSLAGASIPVTPSPRVKLLTDLHPALPADMPLIVDLPTGAYVRSERGHAMVGVQPDQPATGFQAKTDADLLAPDSGAGRDPLPPASEPASLARVITGLYEVTPDHLPVVGAVPGLGGFFVVAGFNGHGIMHGPAAARAAGRVDCQGAGGHPGPRPAPPGSLRASGARGPEPRSSPPVAASSPVVLS